VSGETTSPNNGPIRGKSLTGDLLREISEESQERIELPEPDVYILTQLALTEDKVNFLSKKIEELESKIKTFTTKKAESKEQIEEPVRWKKEDAKKAINNLFEQDKELGYSDIIEKLGINLDLVIEICEELRKERRIEEIK
jgi:vacuolar-type H+-ATPase subunit I/STV1